MESSCQCYRFASQLVDIYFYINRNPLTIYKRPLATLLVLWSAITSVESRSTFSRESWFPQYVPKAVCRICDDRIQLRAVTVHKLPSQTKVEITPTDMWTVTVEIMVRSHVMGFLSGWCRELTYCNKLPSQKFCPWMSSNFIPTSTACVLTYPCWD